MRYSRLATTAEETDEYTPLMLATEQSGSGQNLNTADNAYLLPILNPSAEQSFGSTNCRIYSMFQLVYFNNNRKFNGIKN